MARLITSRVIFTDNAFSTTARRRGLLPASGPPSFAAVVNSRMYLVKTLPRLASCFALRCLMLAHLE
ncbi:hypothetical protein D3C73_1323630 [compost metagenome]